MEELKKIKRRKPLCTLGISLDALQKEIDYAIRQVKLEDPTLNSVDVRVCFEKDDNFNRLVLEYYSHETDAEYSKRKAEEAIINQFEKAKASHSSGFIVDCYGNAEKLSTAAAVITQLRYSSGDCIVSGTPIFADKEEKRQIGINVSIKYFEDLPDVSKKIQK